MNNMDIFKQNGACPIWIDNEKKVNRYICFQAEFDVANVEPTTFYIAADTKYELYINGQLAGFGQYEDYPLQKVYDEYDITSFVKCGTNLLSILVYSQGEDSFQHRSGLPMVIFAATTQNRCQIASNDKIKCNEAQEFVNGNFERITSQRSFNFGFDLRWDDGWREKNVSQEWQNAVICDGANICYLPRPNKKLVLSEVCCGTVITQGSFHINGGKRVAEQMQYASMAYCGKNTVFRSITDKLEIIKDNTYWIVDLGKETAGYIALDIEAKAGAVLDIACGEHLDDMRVRSFVGDRNFAFRCVCREGRQKIRFYIRRLAGRYLQFFAHSGIRVVHQAGLHEVEYPLDFVGTFQSSDRLFNQIYSTSTRTLHLCMHEHYEDCPQREQALYSMDSRNQMLTGYYAFGETVMPRSSLELLGMGQRENGTLEMCAPAKCERAIPGFDLIWVMALKEYALFSGDLDFIRKMQKNMRALLDFYVGHTENGVLLRLREPGSWNFYEWTDGMDNWDDDLSIKADAPLNALFVMALNSYCDLCEWIGELEEKTWASVICDEIIESFHKTFYNAEMGAYQNYIGEDIEPSFSQLTQSFALLADCVPKSLCKSIRTKLLSSELVETSLSHLIFKYDALMQEPEIYGNYVLDDIEQQWGYMLYNGATSFWETILGTGGDGAGSLCHGWSAVPVYIFWRYVMGVYPDAPGKWSVCEPLCGEELEIIGTLKTPDGIKNITKKGNNVILSDL